MLKPNCLSCLVQVALRVRRGLDLCTGRNFREKAFLLFCKVAKFLPFCKRYRGFCKLVITFKHVDIITKRNMFFSLICITKLQNYLVKL